MPAGAGFWGLFLKVQFEYTPAGAGFWGLFLKVQFEYTPAGAGFWGLFLKVRRGLHLHGRNRRHKLNRFFGAMRRVQAEGLEQGHDKRDELLEQLNEPLKHDIHRRGFKG